MINIVEFKIANLPKVTTEPLSIFTTAQNEAEKFLPLAASETILIVTPIAPKLNMLATVSNQSILASESVNELMSSS